jgi:peptidoglycan/xylan/chitin deacetylase (PgdA/CDA1 family)
MALTISDSRFQNAKRTRSAICILLSALVILPCAIAGAYVPGKFYYQGKATEKVIGLTFDDGPGKFTLPILDLLKQHNIRATFFMEGSQVEEYPDIARQVQAAGHEIGNHTYIHFDYHKAKNAAPERLAHELAQTETSLRRALRDPNFKTRLVRMPYGYYNKTWLMPLMKDKGYALVHWSFGEDWKFSIPEDQMIHDYVVNAKPGAVFLFHDGGRHREKTLAVVTAVINLLEKDGYRFIPAEEMFPDAR